MAKALDSVSDTNAGLLGLFTGQQQQQSAPASVFGSILGASAGQTAQQVAEAESSPWMKWIPWAIGAAVLGLAVWFFSRKK